MKQNHGKSVGMVEKSCRKEGWEKLKKTSDEGQKSNEAQLQRKPWEFKRTQETK